MLTYNFINTSMTVSTKTEPLEQTLDCTGVPYKVSEKAESMNMYLEELHSNTGKHELKKCCDN